MSLIVAVGVRTPAGGLTLLQAAVAKKRKIATDLKDSADFNRTHVSHECVTEQLIRTVEAFDNRTQTPLDSRQI